MARYTGVGAYLEWIYSGGTVVLSTDFRNIQFPRGIGVVDASAGGDTDRQFLTILKNGADFTVAMLDPGGSAIYNAVAEGTGGTIRHSPQGTASGSPKHTFAAIAMDRNKTEPYDNVATLEVVFRKNGAISDGSY